MPKIINDARSRIISAAKNKLFESGYTKMSLRDVAAESGIAVGTIYNYFEDKDHLIAMVMLDDWNTAKEKMREAGEGGRDLVSGLYDIRRAIIGFVNIYEGIWRQFSLAGGDPNETKKRHEIIIDQIIDEILELIPKERRAEADGLLVMAAESILTSAMQPSVTEEEFRSFFSAAFHAFIS